MNSIFGLKTGIQEKEVEVLVLYSINTNKGNIKKSYDNTKAETRSEISHLINCQIKSGYINSDAITKILEDFFKIPVETEIPLTDFYDIEIDIKRDYEQGITDKVDLWLELFEESGFILRKDKKVLKFIEIEKSI